MKSLRWLAFSLLMLAVISSAGMRLLKVGAGTRLSTAAQEYLATLDDKQKETSLMKYDAKERVDWHFIPKDHRKGLQIKHMDKKQRKAAQKLLQMSLSKAGYGKAKKIMALEGLLKALEKGRKGGPIRDTQRYYYTVFGQPGEGRWGLSIEGHHMSLNFVVEGDKVISSTPAFFAANPGEIKNDVSKKFKVGERVLADEELLAFELVRSLNDEQMKKALLAEKTFREIRGAGAAQSDPYAEDGVGFGEMTDEQKALAKKLIAVYAKNLPDEVSQVALDEIDQAGHDKIYFAWAGATKPGIGHYYRLQGPTFMIEFVNSQPDAAGNPANHIHCVWRDPRGDFAIKVAGASLE